MAESMICKAESEIPGNGCVADTSVSASDGSITRDRKIEFHLARKSFTGIIGNGDFQLETLNPTVNLSDSHKSGANRGPSPSLKKADGSEFLENWFDPELSFGITVRRIGAGLENLGNTCFLNSVLQCLTYTEPLAAYLQSGKHQTSCRVAGFCALCAIQKHVSRALQSTGRILAPKDLVSNLRCISRNFRNARQEDAHEYMVNLLESMHKCCLPKGVPSESPSAYEKSLVHKIFGGRLRSQVKCMQCSYCSNKFDPFLDLSLEIGKADSLHKALMHFTAAEQLDGGERQYQCQHCKQKVKALKQLTVYKAPYVLTIHLKRFRAHDPGEKINKKVQFGPTLNLKPFVSGSYEGDLKYTLYGVLVHAGWNTHSGHYYSFVRTASGTWYSVDDNRVVAVGEKTVLEQKAYMLFYYRDRRIAVPKKPLDVCQKENMAAIGLRNEMLSASNQGLKGAVQDGSFEKRFSGVDTSTAVKKDESNVFSTKETQLKEESSVQKKNDSMVAENMALIKDTNLEAPTGPFVKDPLKVISVTNPEVEKQESFPLSTLVLCVKGSGDNSNVCNASPASTAIKINDGKGEGSFCKDFSATIQSNCKPHQNPAIEIVITDVASKKINTVSKRGVSNVTQSRDDDDKTSGKIDPIRSPNQPSIENSQVGSIPNVSATGVLADDKVADTGLKSSVSGLIESSSSPVILNGPLHMVAPDQNPLRKVKKKVLKCRLVSMHLGSNILYGASLSLRKKKKHKLSKKRSSGIKNLTREYLEEIDLGPSTSEKTRGTSPASIHPRKKRDNGNFNKKVPNSVGDSLMDIIDGEFRERIDQYGAVQATDKLPHKSSRSRSGLTINQCGAREPDVLKDVNRESMQNGLMSMLSRGLEETIVARWDEVDLPLSQDVESSALKTGSIGYIPDEWDEEYDRGKRKKVRISTNNFGGPNPFQEIASKKARLKKAKMERSSSGNQPFRI